MSRVLARRALDMLDLLPQPLRSQPHFQASVSAQAEQLDKLDSAIDTLSGLVIPITSGDYLYLWEAMTGAQAVPGASYDDRLDTVLAFLSRMGADGTGQDWVAIATRLIGTGWTYRTHQSTAFLTSNYVIDPRGTTPAAWAALHGGDEGSATVAAITNSPQAELGGQGVQSRITVSDYAHIGNWTPLATTTFMPPQSENWIGRWFGIRVKIKNLGPSVDTSAPWDTRLLGRDSASGLIWFIQGPTDTVNTNDYPTGAVAELVGKAYVDPAFFVPGQKIDQVGLLVITAGSLQNPAHNPLTVAIGQMMATRLPNATSPVPQYGDGESAGWAWDGTTDASTSHQIIVDNPATHHVTVYMPSEKTEDELALAQKLFDAITPANTVVTVTHASTGMNLDIGLLDQGQLG